MNPRSVSINWITSRNYDLTWYIGSCIASYALLFVGSAFAIPPLLLFWFWIVSLDGPHVFGTVSRTYLDAEEWRTRGPLLRQSLLWFLAGPAAVVIGVGSGQRLPYLAFLVFAQLWAYWHVVRQHYGFLTLYQKKNAEPSGPANPIDYWSFYVLMLAPFASFLLRHPEARKEIGLGASPGAVDQLLVYLIHAGIAFAVIAYLAKEFRRRRAGDLLNLPKNLFLLACVPLHLLIFLHPTISTTSDLRLFVVYVTIYHNVQYHGIVWFYGRNRYGGDPTGEQYGLASRVHRNFLRYYFAAFLFTISYRYLNWCLTGLLVPFGCGPNVVSDFSLGNSFRISDLAVAFWWGMAFNHYYLDQKIWRVSRDRPLREALALT